MTMSKHAKSSGFEDSFPFLRGLRASLDHLLSSATKGFPDLDVQPTDGPAIQALLTQTRGWARCVRDAHGQVATDEAGYVHPDPVPLLVWFRGGSFQQGIIPRFDSAADVLGDLPVEFKLSYASVICQMCKLHEGKVRRPYGRRPLLDPTVKNWPTIRTDLTRARLLTLVQTKQIVAWVNGRIDSLKTALIPQIRFLRARPRNRVVVEVVSAGTSREAELTNAAAELLDQLATKGNGTALRKVKMELVRSIPELDFWIATRPAPLRHGSQNESRYLLSEEVRGAIHTPLATKK